MPTIRLEKVAKLYKGGGRHTAAIWDIDLEIEQGEFVFLIGSRGAGKSTLLDLISGDINPDQGNVYLDNVNVRSLRRWGGRKLRSRIGRVRQELSLVSNATVYQNLTSKKMGAVPKGLFVSDKLVEKALGLVGMSGAQERYPAELSHSECTRLELARAILHSPPILLLDEITSRMDDDTTWDLFQLLREMNHRGTTVVMSSNAKKYINIMRGRVITLSDGRVIGDVPKGRYGEIGRYSGIQ